MIVAEQNSTVGLRRLRLWDLFSQKTWPLVYCSAQRSRGTPATRIDVKFQNLLEVGDVFERRSCRALAAI